MTDRREKIARMIAFWHGQKITVVKPGRGALTVAAVRGYDSGGGYETERYASAHWQEYLSAADAVIRFMEPDYVG